MALHKAILKSGFRLPVCEKHFHDHDETWMILSGRGTGFWIDHGGKREEFALEAGDVWMLPAGYEHGSEGFKDTGRNSEDFTINVVNGAVALAPSIRQTAFRPQRASTYVCVVHASGSGTEPCAAERVAVASTLITNAALSPETRSGVPSTRCAARLS